MARLTHIVAGALIGFGLAGCGGGAGGESAAAGSGAATALAAEAVTWIDCAAEDRICEFSGSREVRYGANGTYVNKTLTGPVECSNAVFGDPLPGVDKSCSYSSGDSQTPPPPPAEWTYCADEDRLCSFTGTREIRYGANGKFAYQTLAGPIQCSNAVFGDPLPGADKACSYSATVSTTPDAGWKIIDLGTLGGEETTATAINDAGSVVGASQLPDGAWRAFLYQNGKMTDLGTLAGTVSSAAAAINRNGQVVGTSSAANGNSRPFLYDGSALSEVGLPFTAGLSWGRGINDAGDLLIEYAYVGEPDRRCSSLPGCTYFLRKSSPVDLGYTFYQARDLNNAGQIVGTGTQRYSSTEIYQDGAKTSVGHLPNPSSPVPSTTFPADMNNKGEVVGSSNNRPYVYRNGAIADISTIVQGDISSLSALNDNGSIIGTLRTGDNASVFLYDGRTLIDLNTLPAVKTANWILQDVKAINNARQIIGHGINNHGKRRAFLLTPG